MASANIIKDIRKEKNKLIERAKKKGIYENFGQQEYNKLKDKWNRYLNVFGSETDKRINEELNNFFNWCITFDDNKLKREIEVKIE